MIKKDIEGPGPEKYNQQMGSMSMKQALNIINKPQQKTTSTFLDAVNKGHVTEHARKLVQYSKYKEEIAAKRGPGTYDAT